MEKLDDLINEALSAEDEALLERYSKEPGYLSQAFGLFSGRLGWMMKLVGIVQLVLLLGAVYTFAQMFAVAELMIALRWGVGTVVLVQMSALLRSFMGMHFEANRVLREVQRLELRMLRFEDGSRRA